MYLFRLLANKLAGNKIKQKQQAKGQKEREQDKKKTRHRLLGSKLTENKTKERERRGNTIKKENKTVYAPCSRPKAPSANLETKKKPQKRTCIRFLVTSKGSVTILETHPAKAPADSKSH